MDYTPVPYTAIFCHRGHVGTANRGVSIDDRKFQNIDTPIAVYRECTESVSFLASVSLA